MLLPPFLLLFLTHGVSTCRYSEKAMASDMYLLNYVVYLGICFFKMCTEKLNDVSRTSQTMRYVAHLGLIVDM